MTKLDISTTEAVGFVEEIFKENADELFEFLEDTQLYFFDKLESKLYSRNGVAIVNLINIQRVIIPILSYLKSVAQEEDNDK